MYANDEVAMPTETTYTGLRANLAGVLDRVAADQEVIVVRRKNGQDVALVPAAELAGLMETANLLRSPRNARRLLTALRRAEKRQGTAMSVERLRRETGLVAQR
jgi:antitoxin YefM